MSGAYFFGGENHFIVVEKFAISPILVPALNCDQFNQNVGKCW